MVKRKKINDPFAAREAATYEKPIPSREYILQWLRQCKQLVSYDELLEALLLKTDEQCEALRRRLVAMVRDGQLIRTRKKMYGIPQKMDLMTGQVLGHRDGYGFVVLEEDGERLFLTERQMRTVLHGDKVLVQKTGRVIRGRPEAMIVDVLQRNTTEIVGRFFEEDGIFFVVPANSHITLDILIPPAHCHDAKSGQIVVVKLTTQPDKKQAPIGSIQEILGEHMAPEMEIDVAIRAYGLPYQWASAVIDEEKKLPVDVNAVDSVGREDLRDLPFITIDGEDAKDFDDAIYCEKNGKQGWHLYVAIADVSHYVQPNNALDEEARLRGNSVYFPHRVIPMLPFSLSAGLCSLKPDVDRLALVCKATLTPAGKIRQFEFFQAVIHSHARLTYKKAAKMLVDDDRILQMQYSAVFPHLKEAYALFNVLHKNRQVRGALELDMPETKILFDKDKKIRKIVSQERNDAHRLIEEFMLIANVSAAQFLEKHHMPTLYRVHASPDSLNLQTFRQFLNAKGLKLSGKDDPQPIDYANVLNAITDRSDADLIKMVLLRSLSQAVYQPENIGHFGLAYDSYTHFTSPIRRYPDLLVHRAIKHILQGNQSDTFSLSNDDMGEFGSHCTMTEKRADEATRDVVDWLKCEFMRDKIGQKFSGTIVSVMGFGLFVSLQEIYIEGLIHVTSLPNDYYHFDAMQHQLMGERTGICFQVGDQLPVCVSRVDLDERNIDFTLVVEEMEKIAERPSKKKQLKRSRKKSR